jgi:bifunctional DNA-binding transcriptional regulator/antitoxin component of YhaV-PrlF toxin-antitoxin module
MELVTVKTKFQVVVPQCIRKRVHLDIGVCCKPPSTTAGSFLRRKLSGTVIQPRAYKDLAQGLTTVPIDPPLRRFLRWSEGPRGETMEAKQQRRNNSGETTARVNGSESSLGAR